MTDIYEIKTLNGAAYVQAKNGSAATGYARRGIKARKLSGVEARALPADVVIHDAEAVEDNGNGEAE